ncbi:MAG: xanthine dehydrogenase family protein molybdopterin-binding subunit [Deferribacteres bacterium]|nr:xanthine dehydrogenase family protein molybdopterin-binding subunit [candidate division KSB1 bacterium]MCB9501732.1 xanthine dehydrogenase family protein molybdopterin-binding subunit [Deferribacteres bacterium]
MAKQVKLNVGIEDNLEEITLEIPESTPRPWDGQADLKYVSKRVPRVDGEAKTTGRAKYTFDIQLPGMLYGKFLRSQYPAAVIRKIDTSKAENYPGVKAIIPVQEKLPMIVRFAGQEILAVAAETRHQAEEAVKLIDVTYDVRKFVVNKEAAMEKSAPIVFDTNVEEKSAENKPGEESGSIEQKSNIRGPRVTPRDGTPDKVDAALAGSDATVEATFRTQVQTHSPMETHGVVAHWTAEDKLKCYASTQGVFHVRDELANTFSLPKSNVQVITKFMGGGFGAKLSMSIAGFMAAKLARKANRPVRLMLDRKEEHLCVGNRPDSVQTLRIGAKKDGKLTGIKLISYGTAGVGTGAGTSGPARNIYQYDEFYAEESDIFTNAGPGAAFRAPGHPQGAFALEQAIDELAHKLNIDPLEFRLLNTKHNDVRQVQLKIAAEKSNWKKRNPRPGADSGPIKRGIGIANSVWYYFYGQNFQVSTRVFSDGSVQVTNGVQDIGTGITTVIASVAAEELGLKPSDIVVSIGDSEYGFGPSSGGSVTTGGISPAVRDSAYLAKMRMFEIAAPLLETTPENLVAADGKIFLKTDPAKNLSWNDVAKKIPGDNFITIGERKQDYFQPKIRTIHGVHVIEVAVDTETGVVKPERVFAVHDCGRSMNLLTTESQINGGIIQGLSYALYEDRLLDRNTGIMVNPNFEYYKIAGSMDIPEIKSVILNVSYGHNSTGAIGIGEPATVATAGALANAIYNAIGVRLRELPMTPDKVLRALEMRKGAES